MTAYERKLTAIDTASSESPYRETIESIKREKQKPAPTDSTASALNQNWMKTLMMMRDKSLSEYLRVIKRKDELYLQLNSLTQTEKTKTVSYTVFLRCYGRNDFGDAVYGVYYFSISPKRDIGKVERLNN
ncbi:hypothetical protein [Mucilaginibacter gynuensis]|uniref:hypothetical protein n=1 Tax=Mucilaginibacter gynuensis TaxID=1302236 RepID=UPI0031E695EE